MRTMLKAGDNFIYNAFIGDRAVSKMYYGGECIWPGTSMTRLLIADGTVKNMWPRGELAQSSIPVDVVSACIGDIVTSIGTSAFFNQTSLQSIDIPSSVQSFGSSAFKNCTSLTSVSVPASAVAVCESTFENCSQLASVDMPDSVAAIQASAFASCFQLTSLSLGDGLTSIQKQAFESCSSLPSVDLPKSLKTIGAGAFQSCLSLSGIDLPSSLASIGDGCFRECMSLASADVPDSVSSLGSSVFCGCTGMESVALPSSLTAVKESSFKGCASLQSVKLPEQLQLIESQAFIDCTKLSSIEFPETLMRIDEQAFMRCTSLSSLQIPDSVSSILDSVFSECSSLVTADLGRLPSIPASTFNQCKSLARLSIPDSVSAIGDNAFMDCSSLSVFNFGNTRATVPKLDSTRAFCNTPSTKFIVVPDALYDEWKLQSANWSSTQYSIQPSITKWSDYQLLRVKFEGSQDWVDYMPMSDELDNAALIEVGLKDAEGTWLSSPVEVQIGMRFLEVGPSAFENCSSLTAVAFMNDHTELRQYAFRNCAQLQKLLPETQSELDGLQYFTTSVSSLGGGLLFGANAFNGNFRADNVVKLNAQRGNAQYITFYDSKIERLYLPGLLQITGVSKCDVFRGMTNLKYIYMPNIESCDCPTAFHWLTSNQRVVIDFRRRQSSSVPPLSEDFFKRSQADYIQPVIVVDDGKKDAWLADEEWSKYQIVEESEHESSALTL